MKRLSFLLVLVAPLAYSQFVQGPASGSIPGGVIVTTDAFQAPGPPATVSPIDNEQEENEEAEEAPAVSMVPNGAMGSSYQFDSSVIKPWTGVPPVTVAAFPGIPQTNAFPPDPQIAVGPQHIVQAVNCQFRICDKSGLVLKDISIVQWFSTTLAMRSGYPPFDPALRYDHFAGRWIMVWLYHYGPDTLSYYLLSVSDDENPLGTWSNWALPANVNGSARSGDWADFDCLGFDNNALYIVSDQRQFFSDYQKFDKIRIVPKPQLLSISAGPITWTDFWNLRDSIGIPFHVRPSIIHGAPGEYYLLDIPKSSSGNSTTLFRIFSPISAPSMTSTRIPFGQWAAPPLPDQYNSGDLLDDAGAGPKLQSAVVYRDSSIWAVHSVANPVSGSYSCLRYFRISTLTNTVAEDVTFGAPGHWYFYPTIAVDKDKNLAITFSRCGTSEYAGAYFTWRLASDPPNTLRPSVMMHNGEALYAPSGFPARWGDYMGAVVDAADANTFWLMTEYAVSPASTWGTSVTGMRVIPFAGPRISTTEPSLNFGWTELAGVADTLDLDVINVGSASLVISGVSNGREEFKVVSAPVLPKSLATYERMKLRVAFVPASLGAVSDTFVVTSNDPLSASWKIPAIGVGVHAAPADPWTMYATAFSPSGGTVLALSKSYLPPSVIGSPGMLDIRSLAIQPSTMQMYGVANDFGGSSLFRIDCTNGLAFLARRIPVADISALAFTANDSLFCGTASGILYAVRLGSGDTIRVGRDTRISYAGLASSPRGGSLWATAGSPYVNDSVYQVSMSNGKVTAVGATGFAVRTLSLAFDSIGSLFGLVQNALVQIDTSDGHGTLLPPLWPVEGLRAITLRGMISTDVRPATAAQVPLSFSLGQNYPNPFNPTTIIRYAIPVETYGRTSLHVYDILGREVATLVNERKAPGIYEVVFDGTKLGSGVYIYRLSAGRFVECRKMLLMR